MVTRHSQRLPASPRSHAVKRTVKTPAEGGPAAWCPQAGKPPGSNNLSFSKNLKTGPWLRVFRLFSFSGHFLTPEPAEPTALWAGLPGAGVMLGWPLCRGGGAERREAPAGAEAANLPAQERATNTFGHKHPWSQLPWCHRSRKNEAERRRIKMDRS